MSNEAINERTAVAAELAKSLVSDVEGMTVRITEPNSAGARNIEFRHAPSGYFESFGLSRYGVTPVGTRYGVTPVGINFGSRYAGADKAQRRVKIAMNKAKKILKGP